MTTMNKKTVVLVGNPNVGKSTLFNTLTGLRQHTGNWPGKTVDSACGSFVYQDCLFTLVDIPGTYSLSPGSADEKVASDFILSEKADCVLVVIDATCLERNLNLALQVMEVTQNIIVCLNLLDEAKRKNIQIDIPLLSEELGVPVIGTCAARNTGIEEIRRALYAHTYTTAPSGNVRQEPPISHWERIEQIICKTVTPPSISCHSPDLSLDRSLTSRRFALPCMLLLLALVFWITIQGANIPSALLANVLFSLQDRLLDFFTWLNAPEWLSGALILGVYRTSAWVISVMLPPMAIFFPLFTLLEDLGYLPRIAFNLDHVFKRCCACGKQALTMWSVANPLS